MTQRLPGATPGPRQGAQEPKVQSRTRDQGHPQGSIMSDAQDHERLLPWFQEIPAEQVRVPDMPVSVAVAEAEAMGAAASEDQDKLVAVGVAPETIADVAAAAGALRVAEARWIAAGGELKEARKAWAE